MFLLYQEIFFLILSSSRQASDHDHKTDTPNLLTLEVPVDVHHSAGSPLSQPHITKR